MTVIHITSINSFTQSFFKGLGDLPGGGVSSVAYGISRDGSTVIGSGYSANGPEGFRWTEATGLVGLGDLPGGSFESYAYGVSENGSVIVGMSNSANGTEAYRWTDSTGMIGLGGLPGGKLESYAIDVSQDGTVVVGYSNSANGGEAFLWTETTGMIGLGDLPGGDFHSYATGISGDGLVVVGYSNSGSGTEAFRWSETTGMVGLGDLPGDEFYSVASAASADGSVIVGYSKSSYSGINLEAFLWNEVTGMVGLGDLPGGDFYSTALGVSQDGTVVVGGSHSWEGYAAFIWDPLHGMQKVSDWLATNGVSIPPGWVLEYAIDVTVQNGYAIVVGYGWNPSAQLEAWIAKAPIGAETLYPEEFIIVRGELIQGGLNDLFLSDDNNLVIKRPRSTGITGVQIMLDLKSHFQGTSVTQLGFTLEASSSIGGANQKILFKNYQTGTFEEVDSRTATTTDSTAQVIISANPSRFVHSQTGEVHARIVWTKTGFVPANWTTATDFVQWQVWGS
ncbi:MAG TPA: hypothetical protein VNK96_00345 [Fimbriimonadales bacterium]|nr:hypothetical protein [Fimbriimonadales bacterium]